VRTIEEIVDKILKLEKLQRKILKHNNNFIGFIWYTIIEKEKGLLEWVLHECSP